MEAYRLRQRVENGTLHITGLEGLADKDVEVIILVDGAREPGPANPEQPAKRKPGSAKGLITISDDFHLPLDEDALREFHG